MNKIVEDLIQISKDAGEEILKSYVNRSTKSYLKPDRSVVTDADLIAQKIITSRLKKYRYPILSEESEDDLSRLNSKKIWIIDPLDGTLDFLEKTGEFSIMIALIEESKPILGIVSAPFFDKLYFAKRNEGAYFIEGNNQPRKISVSRKKGLAKSRFVVSRHHMREDEKKFLERLDVDTIVFGSLGLKVGLIADGTAEGYINFSDRTAQWDCAAAEIILKEAGGEITDLSGNSFIYNRKEAKNLNGVLASNGFIHDQILKEVTKNEK